MRGLGIVQSGTIALEQPARPIDLPARTRAGCRDRQRTHRRHASRLLGTQFHQGHGIAAPQLGIGRRVAVVQPSAPDAPVITLLNPTIVSRSRRRRRTVRRLPELLRRTRKGAAARC
ncbi:peptide deformylase [Nocardia xishanensis]